MTPMTPMTRATACYTQRVRTVDPARPFGAARLRVWLLGFAAMIAVTPAVAAAAEAPRVLLAQARIDENGVPLNPDGTTSRMPPREILVHKPSGFWTSNRPAVGGAYRWRLLGIAVMLIGATGLLMWRLMRRASAARAAR